MRIQLTSIPTSSRYYDGYNNNIFLFSNLSMSVMPVMMEKQDYSMHTNPNGMNFSTQLVISMPYILQ